MPFPMPDLMRYPDADKVNIYSLRNHTEVVQTCAHKNCYRISLLSGRGVIQYESRSFEVRGSVLLLSKPGTRCNWRFISKDKPSFSCIFTDDFLNGSCFQKVAESEVFQSFRAPVFTLEPEQAALIASVFCKMIAEQSSQYRYKSELLQNHICLLLHAALRMNPALPCIGPDACAIASTAQLVTLVEMHFPTIATIVYYN
jgi:AraC family transcriptional regulator, transcriptional activator of pobA